MKKHATLITEMGLPARAVGELDEAGYKTAGDLTHLTRSGLLRLYGIGPTFAKKIEEALGHLGLSLAEPRN